MADAVTAWLEDPGFEPWLLRTLRAQPGCPGLRSEAFSELLQRCRITIWERRARFAQDAGQPLSALARHLVRSVVLDWLRCRQRYQKRVQQPDHERPAPEPDPGQRGAWVHAVLADRPVAEQAFAQALMQGLSVRAAGQAVGWGWRRTEAARQRLAALIAQAEGAESADGPWA